MPHDAEVVHVADLADLDGVFSKCAAGGTTRATLVVSPTIRPDAAFADAVVKAALAHPGLSELALVHDASSIGFVASTLQLRLPRISVRAMKREEAGVPTADLRKSGERLRYAIVPLPLGADAAMVAQALKKVETAPRIAVLFEGAERPTRALFDLLGKQLRSRIGLQEVILVHPSPSVGFMSSSLALQLSRVKVRVVRHPSDLERLAG